MLHPSQYRNIIYVKPIFDRNMIKYDLPKQFKIMSLRFGYSRSELSRALPIAAAHGRVSVVNSLILAGADIRDDGGKFALPAAAANRDNSPGSAGIAQTIGNT